MAAASVLALASTARAPDRVKLDEARSLIAEAGQIELNVQAHRLTSAYAKALEGDIRKALVDLHKSPELEKSVGAALDAMDRRDPAALTALAETLAAEERALGRVG